MPSLSDPVTPLPDPVTAATRGDPYAAYAAWRSQPPLAWHAPLRIWVASRADAVGDVLAHPALGVRPVAEPVPPGLAGLPAGEIFGALVRMNEGPKRHALPRQALQGALDGIDRAAFARSCATLAAHLAEAHATHGVLRDEGLDAWTFEMPVSAVAQWLGFGDAALPRVAAWTRDFVRCLSPLSTAPQRDVASIAAHHLLERMAGLVAAQPAGIAAAVHAEAHARGARAAAAALANLVGLLSQSYEATAGLLGNAVVALVRDPALRDVLRAAPQRLPAFVGEVARHDPPIQNTRRFASSACRVAGVDLQPGDAALVLLASAGRDPAAHADPDRFDPDRPAAKPFTFGRGRHACPGEAVARTVAATALAELLRRPAGTVAWPPRWHYRPSVNARLPGFAPEPSPARKGMP